MAWRDREGLTFLRCACRLTEEAEHDENASRRAQTRQLLRELSRDNPDVCMNIFNAIHHVDVDTMPGYILHGEKFGK